MSLVPIERLRTQWQELPQESRFAIGILCFVGIGVLGFSAAYLRLRITGPFYVPLAAVRQSTAQYNDLLAQNNQDLELRKKDTDRDGLNDYSELKIYKTSPYLADSDSDGMPDALEIAQGQDPNCPKGQQCIQGLNQNRFTTSTNSDLLGTEADNPVEQFIVAAPDPSTLTTTQKREHLLQTGYVTAAELEDLPPAQIDEVYQAAYEEVLAIRQKLQTAATSTSQTPSSTQATTTTP